MYADVHRALAGLSWDQGRYDVLDFGSEWFGDPDGGWQTYMRWMLKAIVGNDRLNHVLGVYPQYNIEALPSADHSFDMVVADQVLEHVQRPWLAANEVWRVTKPGGIAMVATPGLYPVHPSPLDCWRIMPDGYRLLFPEAQWEWLTFGMWGDRERVGFEYTYNVDLMKASPTYTADEALTQPTFHEGTDGLCPMQIWWVGRKR